MRQRFDAIVFDLDGTLVDTAEDLHLVLAEVFAEVGLDAPPPATVRGMIGDGARRLVERALASTGKEHDTAAVDRLFERFRQRYAEEPCRASRIYSGGEELLATLAAEGLPLGLCTNKPQDATLGLLAALGWGGRFEAVVGGDVLGLRKPDPGHLLAILKRLHADPARSVMVGDSRNDLLTARRAGCPCVLVSFGYTAEPAIGMGAEAVIDRLADLPTALRRLDSHPAGA